MTLKMEKKLVKFEPGTFKYLSPGENITVPDIDSPDQQFEMFVKNKVRRFASGFGCSYETLSRDFSDTSFQQLKAVIAGRP